MSNDSRYQHVMDNLSAALEALQVIPVNVPRITACLDDARSDILDLVDGGGIGMHEKNQLDAARLLINRAVVTAHKRYMPVGQFIRRAREHVGLAMHPQDNVVPIRRNSFKRGGETA